MGCFLRLLNGMFAGYVPNANALIASQAPKNESGSALGTLATGVIAGSLIGPLMGGMLAEFLGIHNVFLLVGTLLLLVMLLTTFLFRKTSDLYLRKISYLLKNSLLKLKIGKYYWGFLLPV